MDESNVDMLRLLRDVEREARESVTAVFSGDHPCGFRMRGLVFDNDVHEEAVFYFRLGEQRHKISLFSSDDFLAASRSFSEADLFARTKKRITEYIASEIMDEVIMTFERRAKGI